MRSKSLGLIFDFLENLDRRIIFLFVALSLSAPLVLNVTLKPARMKTAQAFFDVVENLPRGDGRIVLVAADWGPGTLAENRPQTELAVEHLMRRRIPFAMISMYTLAAPFLRDVPHEVAARLEAEQPGKRWEYGKDWINLGFRPGSIVMIQSLAKASDWHEVLKTDANSTPLAELPLAAKVRTIKDISLLLQFTGLVGVFNMWLQYLPGPPMLHGCTSITIPEAFIYYASKQIQGFFEGVAGAAWYEELLSRTFPERLAYNRALRVNTGLSFAHLVILGFIALGNIGYFVRKYLRIEKGCSSKEAR
jgi:hypothetical protein